MEEEIVYNKIYARADASGKVVHIFSEAFEQPQLGDVCIDELNVERHGAQKYPVLDENGFFNYEIKDGQLVGRDKTEDIKNIEVENIRSRREIECFPIINRGILWYEKLTISQREELSDWYNAWLDAPQTKKIPNKPDWLI